MPSTAHITVLVENTARGEGMLAEHGLAFWIQIRGYRVLFDTGQGMVLTANAYKLGVPLHQADAIVLSHGHYDHTGGLAEVLKTNRHAAVYAHPAALAAKYARKADGSAREIGIPPGSAKALRALPGRVAAIEQPTAIGGGLTATGPVPRVTDFEDPGGPFFLDPPCTRPDPLEDDQSLWFDTDQGIVVLLGCAHSGVVNTLQYVAQLTAQRPFCAVIGGMHLLDAPAERIDRTVEALRQLGVRQVAPGHCTGMAATTALQAAFPNGFSACHVGTVFEF